jgi:hypothetical protein
MVTEDCFVLIMYSAVFSGWEIQSVLLISSFTEIINVYWFRVTVHLQNFLVLIRFEVLTAVNLRVWSSGT